MILEIRDATTRRKMRALSVSHQTSRYGYGHGQDYTFSSEVDLLNGDQTNRRRTDNLPRSFGDDYHGVIETPRLPRRSGSAMFSSIASISSRLLRPSRRMFVDSYVTTNQSRRAGVAERSQVFSTTYPARQRESTTGNGRLRYRMMAIGNGSFIDTSEEPCASEFCSSRVAGDWRPQFKRYLSSFYLGVESKHLQELLFKSLFDPRRYGRRVSGTCDRLMQTAGDVLWKAYEDGWFPMVDYIYPSGDIGWKLESVITAIGGSKGLKEIEKIMRDNGRSEVNRVTSAARFLESEALIGPYNASECRFATYLPIIGPHIPRPVFTIVNLDGYPFGCGDAVMEQVMRNYVANDITYRTSTSDARKAAGTYHYIGYVCPDTGHFNFSDNVYCAFLITSVIESAYILKKGTASINRNGRWRHSAKGFGEGDRWLVDKITTLRDSNDDLPKPIRELYDKALSLENKWHKNRMKVSTWKSPYYHDRGYS